MLYKKELISKFLESRDIDAIKEAKYPLDEYFIYNDLVTNLSNVIIHYHQYKIHLTMYTKNGGTTGEDYVQFLILYVLYSLVGDITPKTKSIYQDVFKQIYPYLGLRNLKKAKDLELTIEVARGLCLLWGKEFPYLFETAITNELVTR